jgi:hypothetical protein
MINMPKIGIAGRIGAVRLVPVAVYRQQCNLFTSKLSSLKRRNLPYGSRVRAQGASEGSAETYPGMYGQWSITQQDLTEVKS